MPENPATSIIVQTLAANIQIAASGTLLTAPVDISSCLGYCGCFLNITGSGNFNLDYLLSNDGVQFARYIDYRLLTGYGATSGPAGDGYTYLYWEAPVANFMFLAVTEAGAVNPIYITLQLAVR